MFPENFSILGSEVPSFALYWGLILGFWISFRYLWKISSILQFVLYSLALLRFLTIQFFCTLWLFDKYKMQDPVQKSVVFPERVKSCNLYRVTGLYSLSILKESKSRRVKSCNPAQPKMWNGFFFDSTNQTYTYLRKTSLFYCTVLQVHVPTELKFEKCAI